MHVIEWCRVCKCKLICFRLISLFAHVRIELEHIASLRSLQFLWSLLYSNLSAPLSELWSSAKLTNWLNPGRNATMSVTKGNFDQPLPVRRKSSVLLMIQLTLWRGNRHPWLVITSSCDRLTGNIMERGNGRQEGEAGQERCLWWKCQSWIHLSGFVSTCSVSTWLNVWRTNTLCYVCCQNEFMLNTLFLMLLEFFKTCNINVHRYRKGVSITVCHLWNKYWIFTQGRENIWNCIFVIKMSTNYVL